MFRDVFPTLSNLYQQAIDALSEREESSDWNPYTSGVENARIYGPAPQSYGLGMGSATEDFSDAGRRVAAEAWLEASSYAIKGDRAYQDKKGLKDRITKADSFVHLQDMPETDLLLSADYAAHEAGFAAAKKFIGGSVSLYHLDNTDPKNPTSRTLAEEIARVVYARACNPNWLIGMKRHGFRGAAEISATLFHMSAFANLADVVGPHLFDSYHDATLGNDDIVKFMSKYNPEALAAMRDCFEKLYHSGLWKTRRNFILGDLEVSA